MTHEEIADLLMGHLTTVPDRPERNGIVWEDDPATDKDGTPRWEVSVGHAPSRTRTLDHSQDKSGELRVIVVTTFGQYGRDAKDHAKAIAAHFAPGTKIGPVKIVQEAHRPGGFKDGTEYRYPVLIRFRALL